MTVGRVQVGGGGGGLGRQFVHRRRQGEEAV